MDDAALIAYRARLDAAAHRLAREHRVRRRRRLAWAAIAATTLVVATTALGATGVLRAWLGGTPAPAEVKRDFAGIRPELGHTTDPDAAAQVARENQIVLHATPTREGGFCLVADVPWLGFDGDGRGYCVKPEETERPLVAGIIGASSDEKSGLDTVVVAGRARFQQAATIRFTDPNGNRIERPLETGGFFVALVTGEMQECFRGKEWTPTLLVLDGQERELARAVFPLWIPARNASGELMKACSVTSPMSDTTANRIIAREQARR